MQSGGSRIGVSSPHTLHTRPLIKIREHVSFGVGEEHSRLPDSLNGVIGKQIERPILFQVVVIESVVPPPQTEMKRCLEDLLLSGDGGKGYDLQ